MALKLANGKGLVVYNFWKMANKQRGVKLR